MSGVVFDQADTRADAEEVLRLIDARPGLFQLGQHGYGARELDALPRDVVLDEVQGAEEALARHGVLPASGITPGSGSGPRPPGRRSPR